MSYLLSLGIKSLCLGVLGLNRYRVDVSAATTVQRRFLIVSAAWVSAAIEFRDCKYRGFSDISDKTIVIFTKNRRRSVFEVAPYILPAVPSKRAVLSPREVIGKETHIEESPSDGWQILFLFTDSQMKVNAAPLTGCKVCLSYFTLNPNSPNSFGIISSALITALLSTS